MHGDEVLTWAAGSGFQKTALRDSILLDSVAGCTSSGSTSITYYLDTEESIENVAGAYLEISR